MCIIGIDPSINSTGICINKEKGNCIYVNINSKKTKKLEKFESKYIKIFFIEKNPTKGLNYASKEIEKTQNIYDICVYIKNILKKYKPSKVIMEGLSYGSNGSLGDLGGLNYAIRMIFVELGIPFEIVPPTTWKKQQIGNANAEKDIIVETWKRLDKRVKDVNDIKLDDLADSYFLSHYSSLES